MSLDTDTPVVVGRIQGPYGIRGWVHLAAYTHPKENILQYRPWLLQKPAAGGQDSPDWQEVQVEQIRPHKQGFVVALSGIADRDAAEALQGRMIGVSARQLPPPAAGEYYWRDLIGAQVVGVDDAPIGQVKYLIETGAHDVLVIARSSGGEVLIPFHDSCVIDVCTEQGLIRVDWSDPVAG